MEEEAAYHSLVDNSEFIDADEIYLDHAGATLPSQKQLQDIFEFIAKNTMANPHSNGPLGDRSCQEISRCRELILDHFGADSDEYSVVFTSGSTAALKLVGECFPWSKDSCFCYPFNSHTSLLGIREFAPNSFCIPSNKFPRCPERFPAYHESTDETKSPFHGSYSLLALPGECNFAGTKVRSSEASSLFENISTEWLNSMDSDITTTRSKDNEDCSMKWLWMLDASKLAATSPIDLTADYEEHNRPHFMCVSFYKMFGYPTGIGALLIKKSVSVLLQKRYWGGGTVMGVAADSKWVLPAPSLSTRLEDGTLNFQAIAALRFGFDALNRAGGMKVIQDYTFRLAQYLYDEMQCLEHAISSGGKLCMFYGRNSESDPSVQGPVITFNMKWADGDIIGFGEVERVAVENNIQLRTGCFCCIGGCQEALGLSADNIQDNVKLGRTCASSGGDVIDGRPTGAVRVSLGYMSTKRDCDTFLDFLRCNFLNKSNTTLERDALQYLEGITNPGMPSGSENIMLRSIYVYPIKSCAGMRVSQWLLSPTGLFLDREWAVVSRLTGAALTQKSHPRLALCEPTITFFSYISCDGINIGDDSGGFLLRITAPGMSALEIAFPQESTVAGGGSPEELSENGKNSIRSVRVCLECQDGVSCSGEADKWFSEYLGTKCYFVKSTGAGVTKNTLLKSSSIVSAGTNKSFSNEAQFLILSLQSVQNLQEKLMQVEGRGPDSERVFNEAFERSFRPNFVVYGNSMSAHDEDEWDSVELTAKAYRAKNTNEEAHDLKSDQSVKDTGYLVKFNVTGACARCSMVNVNPSKGERDPATLKMLASYRKEGNNIFFGQYLAYDNQSQMKIISNQVSPERRLIILEEGMMASTYCK